MSIFLKRFADNPYAIYPYFETKVDARRKFWVRQKKGSSAEVDFVYEYDGMLIPIEEKSGHNAHLKSIISRLCQRYWID